MSIVPTRERCLDLLDASFHGFMPMVRVIQIGAADPIELFRALAAGSTNAALLEHRPHGESRIVESILLPDASQLAANASAMSAAADACADIVADIGIELPRFVGGVIAMLGHESVQGIEPRVVSDGSPHPSGLPDAVLLEARHIIVFDHVRGEMLVIDGVSMSRSSDVHEAVVAYEAAVDRIDATVAAIVGHVAGRVSAREPLEHAESLEPFSGVQSQLPDGRYREMVAEAKELVRSGECVQIVVSQRFEREWAGDPIEAYRELRRVSPAPYHFLLRAGAAHVIGASPEQLVGVDRGHVTACPIAGTRPRGVDPIGDARYASELAADPKELAEHMMLVDLGRNDVARASDPGTTRVVQLCEVERFSHVMHLVSRVEGRLRAGSHPVDALASAFPAGTLTGAPKVRAMELIAGLEQGQRGPYGGAIGCIGHGQFLDMAITIRAAVIAGGHAWVQAGAGIVDASDPAAEEQETRDKARAVLLALASSHRALEVA